MICSNSNSSMNDGNDDNDGIKLDRDPTKLTTTKTDNKIINNKMILFRYIILFYIHLCCFILLQRIITNHSIKINEILYKVLTTGSNSRIQRNHDHHDQQQQRRSLKVHDYNHHNHHNNHNHNDCKDKILYIITTLAEYNTGDRATVRGSDRLQETTIPIIIESITSMIQYGYHHIDIYIVAHYTLTKEREQLIHDALQTLYNKYQIKIGFNIWYDATPLGYDTSKKPNFVKLEYRTLHLAREHRFIIKDKIATYDIFINFEDDMYISGAHVQHYVAISNEISRLYDNAPNRIDYKALYNSSATKDIINHYYGPMTKLQLRRMIPGFMRTEVLLDETKYSAQTKTGPIPIDMIYNNDDDEHNSNIRKQQQQNPFEVNSTICCHVSKHIANDNRPIQPTSSQLMIWETNIFPLGIRRMPSNSWLKWVVLQRGPSQNDIKDSNGIIGDYWTNRNLKYYPTQKSRPSPQEFKYINNQGGWMSIQKQLLLWHTDICLGSFLPPYDIPHYQYDGLDMRNVEWYSGGMQLSTSRHACNMQRIIQLTPNNFSKSLLYHTANNKQRQLSHKREEFFTKANTLLGQLNTIKKNAIAEIP